jgi:hypothetical protein
MNTSTVAPAGEEMNSETQSGAPPDAATESQVDLALIADLLTCLCVTFRYEALRPNLQHRAAALREGGKKQRSEALEAFVLLGDEAAAAAKSQAPAGLRVVPAASAPQPSGEPAAAPAVNPATEAPKYLLLRPFAGGGLFCRAGSMISFDGVPGPFMEPLNAAARARVAGAR